MNRWILAFVVSVLVHILILLFCSGKWKDFADQRLIKLELSENPEPVRAPAEPRPSSPVRPAAESSVEWPPAEKGIQVMDTVAIEKPFSLRHLLSLSRPADTKTEREEKRASQEKIDQSFQSAVRSWSIRADEAARGTDIAGDYIRNKTVPGMIQASRNPAPERKEKEPGPRFDFIPSLNQIHALCLLGEKDGFTGPELYSQTGTGGCTMETWEKEMEGLFRKGFVRRKLVSPRNELTLFGIPVELSGKNRRNRVYRYESAVTRGEILTYLNSRRFLLLDRIHMAPRDSTRLAGELAGLEKRIIMLMESLSNPSLLPVPLDSTGNTGQG